MSELIRFKLLITPEFVGFETADDGNMTDWHTATRIIAEKDAEIKMLRAQVSERLMHVGVVGELFDSDVIGLEGYDRDAVVYLLTGDGLADN